jgi:hypothetical protein
MKAWSRINRNSLAQFMRTRVRFFHVSIQHGRGVTYSVGRNAAKRARRARAGA